MSLKAAKLNRRAELVALRREAESHYRANRLSAAAEACARLVELEPGDVPLRAMAGLVALRLGRREEALGHFRRQREIMRPGSGTAETWLQLGLSLGELGALEEGISVLKSAQRAWPQPVIKVALAEFHEHAGNLDAAEACARRVLAGEPENGAALATLAVVLQKTGRHDEAVVVYRNAIRVDPTHGFLYANLCALMLEMGDVFGMVAVAGDWLEVEPENVEALSFLAHGRLEIGDEAGARHLLDFDRFVRERTIEVPQGYADLDAFNEALAAHVLAHPSLATPPEDHPTWHHPRLQITEELLAGDPGPVRDLEVLMRKAIQAYAGAVPPDPAHPFLAHTPRRIRLSAWGAVLNGAGNQQAHIHKDGWLSGVYYVRIPEEITSGEDFAGGFEVGRPPEELAFRHDPLTRAFLPREGMMLLFPAYMYHRTIPFEAPEKRICIAFDVVRSD